jgi:CRP-like cAMP-binding protein
MPTSPDLQATLRQRDKVRKPKSSVLFRRGEAAKGVFFLLSGKVSLDFGVDSSFGRAYGPGALVGLPASMTSRPYSMTATVTEDAEVVFWPVPAFDALLRERPDLCRELIVIPGEKMAENQKLAHTVLHKPEHPIEESTVV